MSTLEEIRNRQFIGYLDAKEKTIRIYKSEHYLWSMWNELRNSYKVNPPSPITYTYRDYVGNEIKKGPLRGPYIGRWHFRYENDKGQYISLVFTERGFRRRWYWEICSGGTCSNCNDAEELFDTRKEAEKRILELLTTTSTITS